MERALTTKPIYVSAVDAGKLIGKSTRTIHRWIEQGKLQARHQGPNQLLILLADVEALAHSEPTVVTPLSLLQGQTRLIEALQTQIAEVQEVNASLLEQVAAQGEQVERLERVVRREYEAHAILQKLMSLRSDALESIDVGTLREKRAEVGRLVRDLSVLEKRGLPPGSQTLSIFCKRHSGPDVIIHASTVKGMVQSAGRSDLITVWKRPTASMYTHEWWIAPEQQPKMIRFWQSHGKPFVPCPDCPHEDNRAAPGAEAPIASAEMVS